MACTYRLGFAALRVHLTTVSRFRADSVRLVNNFASESTSQPNQFSIGARYVHLMNLSI
jgi:hypothetical protein